MQFAKTLEQIMKDRGWTMYKISKLCGVSQTTVKNWMTGKTTPYKKQRPYIAYVLEVSEDELFNGKKTVIKKKNPTTKKGSGVEETDMSFINDIKKLSPAQIEILRAAVQGFLQSHTSQDVQE